MKVLSELTLAAVQAEAYSKMQLVAELIQVASVAPTWVQSLEEHDEVEDDS